MKKITSIQSTPSPWVIFEDYIHSDGHHALVVGTIEQMATAKTGIDHDVICSISPIDKVSELDYANARLIAAAPETAAERDQLKEQIRHMDGVWTKERESIKQTNAELLEALESVLKNYDQLRWNTEFNNHINSIISKAKGLG